MEKATLAGKQKASEEALLDYSEDLFRTGSLRIFDEDNTLGEDLSEAERILVAEDQTEALSIGEVLPTGLSNQLPAQHHFNGDIQAKGTENGDGIDEEDIVEPELMIVQPHTTSVAASTSHPPVAQFPDSGSSPEESVHPGSVKQPDQAPKSWWRRLLSWRPLLARSGS